MKALLPITVGLLVFAASGCSRKTTVASVGGEKITSAEVLRRLESTPPAYRQYMATPEGRKQFVDIMVREKVLLVSARNANVLSQPNLQTNLKEFAKAWRERWRAYQDNLMMETFLEQLRTGPLAVSDAEIQGFYNAHRELFASPKEYDTSHILVESADKAQEILSRLKRGEKFETLARQYSKDPQSAAAGGRIAPFRAGQLLPEYEAAIAPLKAGQVAGPVKTNFGFHVIRKNGERQLPPPPVQDIAAAIKQQLEKQKFDGWVETQKKALGVTVSDAALSKLIVPSTPQPQTQSPQR